MDGVDGCGRWKSRRCELGVFPQSPDPLSPLSVLTYGIIILILFLHIFSSHFLLLAIIILIVPYHIHDL